MDMSWSQKYKILRYSKSNVKSKFLQMELEKQKLYNDYYLL